RNFRAQRLKPRREEARYAQRHVSLLDGHRVTELEPTLFHPCPSPAEVPGIEGDLKTSERRCPRVGWQRAQRGPPARDGPALCLVSRKMKNEIILFSHTCEDSG